MAAHRDAGRGSGTIGLAVALGVVTGAIVAGWATVVLLLVYVIVTT